MKKNLQSKASKTLKIHHGIVLNYWNKKIKLWAFAPAPLWFNSGYCRGNCPHNSNANLWICHWPTALLNETSRRQVQTNSADPTHFASATTATAQLRQSTDQCLTTHGWLHYSDSQFHLITSSCWICFSFSFNWVLSINSSGAVDASDGLFLGSIWRITSTNTHGSCLVIIRRVVTVID